MTTSSDVYVKIEQGQTARHSRHFYKAAQLLSQSMQKLLADVQVERDKLEAQMDAIEETMKKYPAMPHSDAKACDYFEKVEQERDDLQAAYMIALQVYEESIEGLKLL